MLEVEPNHVKAAYARATCYNLRGDYQMAIEDYNLALQKDQEMSEKRKSFKSYRSVYSHSIYNCISYCVWKFLFRSGRREFPVEREISIFCLLEMLLPDGPYPYKMYHIYHTPYPSLDLPPGSATASLARRPRPRRARTRHWRRRASGRRRRRRPRRPASRYGEDSFFSSCSLIDSLFSLPFPPAMHSLHTYPPKVVYSSPI